MNRIRVFVACVGALCAAFVRANEPAPLPETTPWNLERLYEAPKFEWGETYGTVRSLFYEGDPYNGKPTRVFAYYATPGTMAQDPSLDHDLPGVVLIHGGGGTAFREWCELWAKRGYAAISMDLAGYQPIDGKNAHAGENRTRLPEGGPDQGDDEKFGSIDKPIGEQWPYHAVTNAIRAHSLLRNFPEVDPDRTAVTGISWGGYLTSIVAGVDNRFKAAVPVYGCGFLHENSVWLDRFEAMSPAQRERWVALWEPSRYLPSVSMPILFVNGTNDFAYPLDSYMKSYDVVTSPKQFCITVNMPHGHPPGWAPQEIGLFVDQYLRGGKPLALVDEATVVNDTVHLPFKSSAKITEAALHFTTETTPINQRAWQTQTASVAESEVTAAAAPPEATAWFLTVTDERGAIVSTRVYFAPKTP